MQSLDSRRCIGPRRSLVSDCLVVQTVKQVQEKDGSLRPQGELGTEVRLCSSFFHFLPCFLSIVLPCLI